MHGVGADIFTANMYLAEDWILCWEVSKRGGAWTLYYVKSVYAVTDVPDQVGGFFFWFCCFFIHFLSQGPGTDLAAQAMAECLVLCGGAQHGAFLLHTYIQVFAYVFAQGVGTCGDALLVF